jgi:hypothetical protein
VYVVLTGSSFSGSNRLALNFVNLVYPSSGSRRMLQPLGQTYNFTNSSMVISPGPSTNGSDNTSYTDPNATNGTSN